MRDVELTRIAESYSPKGRTRYVTARPKPDPEGVNPASIFDVQNAGGINPVQNISGGQINAGQTGAAREVLRQSSIVENIKKKSCGKKRV